MKLSHCKQIVFLILFFATFTISLTATSQTTGDYRSNATSVTWQSAANWQRWDGSAWQTAATAPAATTFTNNVINVLSGHTLAVTTAPVNNNTVSVTLFNTSGPGSGNTINVAGSIIFTGSGTNCITNITLSSNNILFVTGSITLTSSGSGNSLVNLAMNGTLDLTNKQFTWGVSGGGGTNTFTINGTLITANANGVYNSATAAIPTPITKTSATLATTATYILNGGNQTTSGLPTTLNTLEINSTGTVTLSASTTASTALNLKAGTLINTSTNNIILGTSATITRSGGSLSVAPTFGTTVNVVYAQHTAAITTGVELPTTPSVLNNLTINNSNGVNLNAACTVNGTITLTNGLFDLGNNDLTSVNASTPISGGAATSYFKTTGTGTIKAPVANTATVTFPVGNSSYNALSITNNTGTADAFAVRVYDAMNTNGSSSGTAVSTARVNRTWDIIKTTANTGAGVDFVFNWNAGDVAPTMSTPTLFHYTTGWEKQTGNTNSTATSLTYTGYTGSFSPFAIADGTLASLPVSFLSFTAKKKEQAVLLNWTTASEQNADTYIVQHSANGNSWNTVGRVKAVGNSNTTSAYNFIHASPLVGKNFYRIYQVDIDGKGYYTPIVQLTNNQTATGKILSNPVSNGLLTVQLNSNATVRLYSPDGRMLIEKQCTAGVHSINVSMYPKGMYQVRMGNKMSSLIIQ